MTFFKQCSMAKLDFGTVRSVVPNLFLTVAHFHFENFTWPYSQSNAQLQFSTILSSSVARIPQRQGGLFWKLETSVNELDPNFHQSWIRLKRLFRPKTGDFQKKKRSSPKFKRFFRSKSGDLQTKKKHVYSPFTATFCNLSDNVRE